MEIIREFLLCPEHGIIALTMKSWPLVTMTVTACVCYCKGIFRF